jgi:enoyl-CoA hydratase
MSATLMKGKPVAERIRAEVAEEVKSIGHVGLVTIDRPEVRNALRHQSYAELEAIVAAAPARCLVITGTDPAFCSGDDVKAVLGAGTDKPRRVNTEIRLTPAVRAILERNIPMIAAVNGPAVGWGMELALLCDIRVASERARFGEVFVRRGLCSDVPGLALLAHAVGREAASELLFTGRVIEADEAKALGLVSRVVAHDDTLPTAMRLAEEIAANPPLAVQQLKAGMRQALDPDWNALGRWVATSLATLFASDDFREGVSSFVEKRAPEFQGR